MKIKTSELRDAALDWAVAKCESGCGPDAEFFTSDHNDFIPSTDWSQGGPIIEREKISIWPDDASTEWLAEYRFKLQRDDEYSGGPTPLIAAMRCYVASKLGDEVEIPDELVTT